jgi:hypothetical protein
MMYQWHEQKQQFPDGRLSMVYILRQQGGPILCHIGFYEIHEGFTLQDTLGEMLDTAERIAQDNGLQVTSWRSQILGS